MWHCCLIGLYQGNTAIFGFERTEDLAGSCRFLSTAKRDDSPWFIAAPDARCVIVEYDFQNDTYNLLLPTVSGKGLQMLPRWGLDPLRHALPLQRPLDQDLQTLLCQRAHGL